MEGTPLIKCQKGVGKETSEDSPVLSYYVYF